MSEGSAEPPAEPTDPAELAAKMHRQAAESLGARFQANLAAASARIAAADAEAYEAQVAFAAGRFPEYFQKKLEAAQKRIEAEYERITGSQAAGGDSEAGG